MKIDDGFARQAASVPLRLPLTGEDFRRRAAEISELVERVRPTLGLSEALMVAGERFVDDEAHPELRRFGEVLTMARRQAVIQQRLDEDRERLHHWNLDHGGRVSVGHHYEMLRHEACSYNHALRGLIESCGQYFSRDALMGWLSSLSQGHAEWARGEVTGATSEVALHAALQGLPELRGLRYASVEEDLVGYDYVAEWQGKLLTVDAKTGFYPPLTESKHGHRHLEISVPRDVVQDFRVTRHGLDLLRREVRQALQRDVGVVEHVGHHYYAPVIA